MICNENTNREALFPECNEVYMIGEFLYSCEVSHKNNSTVFYRTVLRVRRNSGEYDYIPLVLEEKDRFVALQGDTVCLKGLVLTHYKPGKFKNVLMYVMVREIEKVPSNTPHENVVYLAGDMSHYVEPDLRMTPLGRQICDFVVQRKHRTRDYTYNISCVGWGRTAKLISCIEKGRKIAIKGRFQSRVYWKAVNGDELNKIPIRTHEISVTKLLRIHI